MILGLYSKLFPNLSSYNDMFWEQIGNTLAMIFPIRNYLFSIRLIYRCFAYYF